MTSSFQIPEVIVPTWLGVDEFHISTNRHPIRTVLGSCVGIIIADPVAGIFGVNHYLTTRSALPLSLELLREIRKLCHPTIAIVAGGSQHINAFNVGQANIDFARQFVAEHGLKLIREDVGGLSGRTVLVEMAAREPTIKVKNHSLPGERDAEKHGESALDSSRKAYEFLLEMVKKSGS